MAAFALVRIAKNQHHGTIEAITEAVNYELNLASSGKLKLRAKALLATGTSEDLFEAWVLLHEAARIQEHATRALPICPPATRLAALAEVCWCYVEGRESTTFC